MLWLKKDINSKSKVFVYTFFESILLFSYGERQRTSKKGKVNHVFSFWVAVIVRVTENGPPSQMSPEA